MSNAIVQAALIAASVACLITGHEVAAMFFGVVFWLSIGG